MSATQLATHLQTTAPLLLDVREPWEFDICHIDGGADAWARTVDADMPVY